MTRGTSFADFPDADCPKDDTAARLKQMSTVRTIAYKEYFILLRGIRIVFLIFVFFDYWSEWKMETESYSRAGAWHIFQCPVVWLLIARTFWKCASTCEPGSFRFPAQTFLQAVFLKIGHSNTYFFFYLFLLEANRCKNFEALIVHQSLQIKASYRKIALEKRESDDTPIL